VKFCGYAVTVLRQAQDKFSQSIEGESQKTIQCWPATERTPEQERKAFCDAV